MTPITTVKSLDNACLLLFAGLVAEVPAERLDTPADDIILNEAQLRTVRTSVRDLLEAVDRRLEELSKPPPTEAPIESSKL